MSSHDEPWQVFNLNGSVDEGHWLSREKFSDDYIMGASHVWIWRKHDSVVEILLQQRAEDKMTWPGYFDISVAGHIDKEESPIRCALREAKEEMGLVINPDLLLYIFSLRTPLVGNEIDHVYLYEVGRDYIPSFDDGEVQSSLWMPLVDFSAWTSNPDVYKLVNQGPGYFSLLLERLRRV